MLEIHAVDAGDRGRDSEDRGPGSQLTSDDAGALLLDQVAEFEYRCEDLTQATRYRLDAANMIENVAEVMPCFGIDAGQIVARKLIRRLGRWVQPLIRRHRTCACDFSIRFRKDLQIDARVQSRLRPLPAGHGTKALLAKIVAINGGYDMLIFMVDTDLPDQRRHAEIIAEIEDGFARIEGSISCIPCVPMSASESWMMADPGAWVRAADYNGPALPRSPERTWGPRDDPEGGHPHQAFARVCEDAGRSDSRATRVEIVEATEWNVARVACPVSLEPFLAKVEADL